MSQMHLFRPARPLPGNSAPDPTFVRKHLMRVLRLVIAADFMPWPPAEAGSWIERFPKLAQGNLPPDEATELIAMFQSEITRLEQASTGRR
jgi:hypothetical protein